MTSNELHHRETPFYIDIAEEKIQHLQQKLANTSSSETIDSTGRDYQTPSADVLRLFSRWKDGYDWRKHERELNLNLPQFKTELHVDNFGILGVHFIHQKSNVPEAIPLLFIHGWPGTFLEVRKILPLLITESTDHPSFHVVAMSLPGYGFSDVPRKSGFGITQYAETGQKLMLSLGYEEYITQGSDLGFFITRHLGKTHARQSGHFWRNGHLQVPPPNPPTFGSPWTYFFNSLSRCAPDDKANVDTLESGKSVLHLTRMNKTILESPIAFLAWVYKNLLAWTKSYTWDDDEVLTWVSIQWFSSVDPAVSLRVHQEMIKSRNKGSPATNVGLAHSYFPQDLLQVPRLWSQTPSLVVDAGHHTMGRLAAYERPEEFVADLRRMFGKKGLTHGALKGKMAY